MVRVERAKGIGVDPAAHLVGQLALVLVKVRLQVGAE
jgi:hypothetical protein